VSILIYRKSDALSTAARRLAQYELLDQLGKGHVGEVWKARDLSLHRNVAIKICYTDLQRSEAHFLTRLTTEGQALVMLRHPNIVPIHEVKVARPAQLQETTAYLVMDYIEGQTLADYLRATTHQGSLPTFADIIYLFTSLCAAIDYAHQRGIVHGNLKPSNILLSSHNTTRFGAGEPLVTDFALTGVAGMLGGSCNPFYTAPEQAQGFPANPGSDIYTLGVLLYEFCTGIVPFRDDNPIVVMTRHIHRLPTPPMLINPAIPPALSEVILRALAKDPAMRFAQASVLATAVAATSSLQSIFPIGKPLLLDHEHLFNTPPRVSSILGVAQPYPRRALPTRPLTPESLQHRHLQSFASRFPASSSRQTRPLPAASVEPTQQPRPEAQLSDTRQQTAPHHAQMTDSGKSFRFKSLPSLPTMPATSLSSTAPSTQPTARVPVAQPSINTSNPRITVPQMPVPVSRAVQPERTAGQPYYNLQDKQERSLVSIPAQTLSPSLATRTRLFYTKAPGYIIFASLLVIILVFGSAIGINLLINKNQSLSTATGPGQAFFQDDALGQNDQLRIDMQNVTEPPQGQSYFAWLQDATGHTSPLGPLSIQSSHIAFLYPGSSAHTNLLSIMQGLLITTVDQGSTPQSANESSAVYQASFDADTLTALKNILYQTPGLPDHGSITAEILNVIGSINDKAESINDSLNHDNPLVIRQAARIIELLDGTAYAAQSGDCPATIASELNAPIGLLSSPTQSGYLDILNQQLQQLQQVSQNAPDRLQHIQNVENAVQDLHDWLQNLRTYDVQLLKAPNLSAPAIVSTALQLKHAAADSYTGRTIPPNTAAQSVLGSAGATQAYTEAQYMATLDLTQVG
jgi:serine/threonine protein kinase